MRSLLLRSAWQQAAAPGGSQAQAAHLHTQLPLLLYKAKYRVSVSADLVSIPSQEESPREDPSLGHQGALHLPDLLTCLWRSRLSLACTPGVGELTESSSGTSSGNEADNGIGRTYEELSSSSAEDEERLSVAIDQWVGEAVPRLAGAMWSDHYERHPRDPDNVELAPWVAPRYTRRRVVDAPAVVSSPPTGRQ